MIFHQFSYTGDSKQSVLSIRSIRRLFPDSPIYLWSDASAPVDPVLDYGDGVQVRQTTFRRMGNLNGAPCVLGMRECYAIGYAENPSESYHVKFDPDLLMLTRGKIDEIVESGAYFFCPGHLNSYILGWFQIHSRAFHEDYQKVPCIRRFCSRPSFGEDAVFHEAAMKLAEGRQVAHQNDINLCLPHHYGLRPYSESFGNSVVLIYNKAKRPKITIDEIMDEFYDEFLASQS